MINRVVIVLFFPYMLSASLLDFRVLSEAKEGYAEGNYSRAIDAYESLEKKSDEVRYDEANSYYRLKEYKKAKRLYSSINKDSLLFNKWHNLGNTHAQLGEIDEGIKAYEEALKIKEDQDTRFNLELLKKKKKEQEKRKKNDKSKDNKDKDNKKDNKDKNNKDKDNKKDKESRDKNNKGKDSKDKDNKKDKKKNENRESKSDQDKKQEEKRSDEKERENKNSSQATAPMKREPISDKELRKYQKMLDQRGINTLMVPLKTKGDENHELKPW
jgi:Ca-activated chloride channel family protein